MAFISKLTKWLVIILCVCLILWLITYLTTNVLLNKIDDFLDQNRNLSNFSLQYSKPLNNYLYLLSFYQWFRPNNPKLLISQSYLLTLRNHPYSSKSWNKDREIINSNLKKTIFIDKNQLSVQDYLKLAFAATISGDRDKSKVFSDLAIQKASTDQISEIAFFNYWYLKNYQNAETYYDKYFQIIGGYDKDPSTFIAYLDLELILADSSNISDKLKTLLKNISLIKYAKDPMPYLKQKTLLRLYELCYHNYQFTEITTISCDGYWKTAEVLDPKFIGLIVSKIKVQLFELGVPESFLYFNVKPETLTKYREVFQNSFSQLSSAYTPSLQTGSSLITDDYFYLFLLGYISEFNGDLLVAKDYYQQYLDLMYSKTIIDSEDQYIIGTALYRLSRVNIILDNSFNYKAILEKYNQTDYLKPWKSAKELFSDTIIQENKFLNQNIANALIY